MTDVIRIEGLSKTFGGVTALKGLSLTVAEGEIFGLVGPDGAGKTTALRMLASVMEPSSGDAWVCGHHIVKDAEALKENIGYMSQQFGLYPDLTVMENIDFYADIYSVPHGEREERIERLLAFSNLAPFKNRRAGNLSGGMKQKLGLTCALVHTPKALFLDEPTNGVDPVSRRDFWKILYQLLQRKVTIFLSTAYMDEAERCNRVALIDRGERLACGTPREIKTLLRESILEIHAEQPRRVAALLRERSVGDGYTLFGNRLHVMTRQPDTTEAQARSLLGEAGIGFTIRRIEPDLEDVFISMVTQKRESADHAA